MKHSEFCATHAETVCANSAQPRFRTLAAGQRGEPPYARFSETTQKASMPLFSWGKPKACYGKPSTPWALKPKASTPWALTPWAPLTVARDTVCVA